MSERKRPNQPPGATSRWIEVGGNVRPFRRRRGFALLRDTLASCVLSSPGSSCGGSNSELPQAAKPVEKSVPLEMSTVEPSARNVESVLSRLREMAPRPPRAFLTFSRDLEALRQLAPQEFGSHLRDLKISRRLAYYFLEVLDLQKRLGLTDNEVHEIGWTKLQAAGLDAQLLEDARTLSVEQMVLLKKGRSPSFKRVTLRLSAEDYETFRAAVLREGASVRGRGLSGVEAAVLRLVGLSEPSK